MKWISDSFTRDYVNKHKLELPKNFCHKIYIETYPDLIVNGIDNEQKAIEHYLLFGRYENRIYHTNNHIEQQEVVFSNIKPECWYDSKNIMYFAPTAPDFDESSGGNRLLQILDILTTDLKFNVYFLCNGYSNIKHINILKDLNIPVYLPDKKNNIYLDKTIKYWANKKIHFDYAIFSWFDIARQYMNIVKNYYPNIKTMVDSVDVHWLREQRGNDTKQLNIDLSILNSKKNIEKQTYIDADVVFAVTENDKKELEKEIGYRNIKILSNIHEKHPQKPLGHNIFFIGNYSHGPNIQAAKECIEIYNLFQNTETYKNLSQKPKLLIAGPNMEQSLSDNPNILFLGKIDNLDTLYNEVQILLSPLYWGAGIKGKICDTAMRGVPVLTSDIGNEGINLINNKEGLIANNKNEFVHQLCHFFKMTNKEKQILGLNGQEKLNKIVSRSAAKNILKHSLETKHIVLSIVTYNQTEKLIKCIQSILNKTSYTNFSIVIHDNGGDTKTSDAIKLYSNDNRIRYIKNNTNDFFIIPNNKVISDPEYQNSDIVLINDDLEILTNDWLSYLYSSAYSADYICAVGGKTIFPTGKLAEAGAELYNDGTGKNKGRYQDPKDPNFNHRQYTGYCSGCLLYMRRDIINKIGPLSHELEKMYYEDSEWQYRAHIDGYQTIYDPRCEAIHDEGSSSGTDLTSGTKKYQNINKRKFLSIYRHIDIEKYN